MYSSSVIVKPCKTETGKPVRLLDQVRELIRYKHYSYRTEQAYIHWTKAFVHFHKLRHPKDMGAPEVEQFLSWLANSRDVAPSTHNQALSALLFLYRQILGIDLPWMDGIGRPKKRESIWEADRGNNVPGVEMPDALARKYPNASISFPWFWVWPSPTLATDPVSGIQRRHPLYEQRLQRAIKVAVSAAGLMKPNRFAIHQAHQHR